MAQERVSSPSHRNRLAILILHLPSATFLDGQEAVMQRIALG
jgi:hypothetical protein